MNRHSAGNAVAGASPTAGGAKRARILDAAVRVFAAKGFYHARVSEIANLAGVADGTIYLYFKSKDDLLISLFEDRMDDVIANVRGAVDGPGTPVERLRRLVTVHLSMVQLNPEVAEVLTVELRQSSKFLKEYTPSKFAEFLKLIARTIEAGQRDGSIRRELDAHVVARALFGALDELVLAWVLAPRAAAPRGKGKRTTRTAGLDLTRAGETLADLYTDGLCERRAPADRPPSSGPGPSQPTTKRRAS